MWVDVDEDVPMTSSMTDEEIIASVRETTLQCDIECDSDDTNEPQEVPATSDVIAGLETALSWFEGQPVDSIKVVQLRQLLSYARKENATSKSKQSKITSFFTQPSQHVLISLFHTHTPVGCADAVGLDAAHAFSTPQKSKRMRTSFKHHQLRTMKSFFALNHNPDAKDLKQLSQKTGLTKRVLQVWFQNARAKFRRNLLRPEESTLDKATDGHSLASQPAAGELSSPPLSPALSVTTLTDLTNPMRPTVTSVPCMESAGSPSRQMQQHAQLF
uniref:LIM/homeobox protein Lhx9-like n=1 Tax=Myxine glutinosa TaxID=7769 RepID=UPI00358F1B8B